MVSRARAEVPEEPPEVGHQRMDDACAGLGVAHDALPGVVFAGKLALKGGEARAFDAGEEGRIKVRRGGRGGQGGSLRAPGVEGASGLVPDGSQRLLTAALGPRTRGR